MKLLFLITIATFLTIAPCFANDESSLFRSAFACPDQGVLPICIFGTIHAEQKVTIVAKDWKSSAVPIREFPNTEFDNGFKTITHLQVTTPPPKGALAVAVLAAAETVTLLPLKEVQDQATVDRIVRHIKSAKGLNLDPDFRLLKTRLLRLSSTILLSETFLASSADAAELEKQLPTGCGDCSNIPMSIGRNLDDLFREIRSDGPHFEQFCGRIELAFALSGRTYLGSHAFDCGSDAFSAMLIHDLSDGQPKLVFK